MTDIVSFASLQTIMDRCRGKNIFFYVVEGRVSMAAGAGLDSPRYPPSVGLVNLYYYYYCHQKNIYKEPLKY